MKSWFKKRKSIDVNPPSGLVLHWLLDCGMDNPVHYASQFGAASMSPEVLAMEERDSEERVQAIASLIPIVALYSQVAGTVIAAQQLDAIPEEMLEALGDEYPDFAKKSVSDVVLRSTTATISQLVALGVLKLGDGR